MARGKTRPARRESPASRGRNPAAHGLEWRRQDHTIESIERTRLPREEGEVLWRGENVRRNLHAYHSEMAYGGHEPPLKADLTARENLRYWIGVRRPLNGKGHRSGAGRSRRRRMRDRAVRTPPAGQRRRVALAGLTLLSVPLVAPRTSRRRISMRGRTELGQPTLEAHVARARPRGRRQFIMSSAERRDGAPAGAGVMTARAINSNALGSPHSPGGWEQCRSHERSPEASHRDRPGSPRDTSARSRAPRARAATCASHSVAPASWSSRCCSSPSSQH